MSDILLLIATAHVLGKRKKLPDCWSEISMNMGYPATGHLDTDSLKALFINPTDAQNYKITGMLKQLKFPQLLRHVSVHSGTIIRELFRA